MIRPDPDDTRPGETQPIPQLVTFGAGDTAEGVELADARALLDLIDEGVALDSLR